MRLSVRRRLKMRNKRTASRHFSGDRRDSHCSSSRRGFWGPLSDSKLVRFLIQPIIQASKDYFSQQMKLHSLCLGKKRNLQRASPSQSLLFPFFFDAFMQKRKLCVGSLLPSWRLFKSPSHIQNSRRRVFDVLLLKARRKGILTFFLFSNFGTLQKVFCFIDRPFLTNLDLLQGRLTRC